jgi:hypothetical protein
MRILSACRFACLAVLLWFMSAGSGVRAQAPQVSAAEVKAAFLYNFANFVTWPEETGAQKEVVIGVLGSDEVEEHLRRIPPGQTAPGRPVSVRRVESANDLTGVHILFIGAAETNRLGRILARVGHRPVLTVTEVADGLKRGSIINLVTGDRVQIEISLAAAANAGLQLNSRLLGVATRIKKGEQGGSMMYAGMRLLPASMTLAL